MADLDPTSCVRPRLEMRGIRKRFGATVALDGVDLAVPGGRVHALVGENGAGKSTLMKVLSGAVRPDAGEMLLDGVPHRPRNPHDARHRGVAMIYQELSLAPHLTVEENIVLGDEPTRLGFVLRRQVRQRALEAMKHFEHPEIRLDAPVRRLSAAARQLVEIARAVASGCRVLVLDEPTSSLAEGDVRPLFELIANLKRRGLAIVYISHFIEEVKRIADDLTVLRDGRVAGGGAAADLSYDSIVSLMVGRHMRRLYPRTRRTPGEVVLEVEGLAGHATPVSASLQLRRGEVLGVAGLVGAGRTELLRAIFGLDEVRRGRIRLGAHAGPASPVRRWAQGAGFLSEDRKTEGLAANMTLADNVTMTRLRGFGPLGLVLPYRQDAATAKWIGRLGIHCRSARQPVADLSGGNQQKAAIARLLQHDADVLLLDEPTRGIDVGSKAEIYRLIDLLAAGEHASGAARKAVLIVSSYLPELLGICDRIAVMVRGKLAPARPVEEFDEHSLMLQATRTAQPSAAEGDP